MANRNDVAKSITVLRAALPKQTITSKQFHEMINVWTAVLEDIPAAILKLAVRQWISQDTPWFPSVGQLRHIAFGLMQPPEEKLVPAEGWAEVKRALSLGRHRFESGEEAWSSPAVERAFHAIGGWTYFRYAPIEAEMSDRARFIDALTVLQRQQVEERRMLPEVRAHRENLKQLPAGESYQVADRMQELAAELESPNGPGNGRPHAT
jgi:hypothetical protein